MFDSSPDHHDPVSFVTGGSAASERAKGGLVIST